MTHRHPPHRTPRRTNAVASPRLKVSGNGRAAPVLVTGGAGFIGTNMASRLLAQGHTVVLLDNLARPGVEKNLAWLREHYDGRVRHIKADVRDADTVAELVRDASAIFHFAGQVAVTTSLSDPVDDFEVNARGTLNVLEAIRACTKRPPLLFTSTNKVYGGLEWLTLDLHGERYQPVDDRVAAHGIDEQTLDFHSPYGCSKGAADQYVLDYARTFGLPTVVFRMSCIYGTHQMGTEDQGWVAHFLISALNGDPITLYGDGRQVRDILFVDDLIDAMLLAVNQIDRLQGRAFNIGGGPQNTVSLLELLDQITLLTQQRPPVHFDDWRPGDQRYYVSNTDRLREALDWTPRIGVGEGVQRLYDWLRQAQEDAVLPTTEVRETRRTA